jgi:meiotic recombination protein SPO11
VGCINFRDDGDYIDCTKMGVGGKAIPGLVDRISDISVIILFFKTVFFHSSFF